MKRDNGVPDFDDKIEFINELRGLYCSPLLARNKPGGNLAGLFIDNLVHSTWVASRRAIAVVPVSPTPAPTDREDKVVNTRLLAELCCTTATVR
jgi:hypothetical protein